MLFAKPPKGLPTRLVGVPLRMSVTFSTSLVCAEIPFFGSFGVIVDLENMRSFLSDIIGALVVEVRINKSTLLP